MNRPRDSRPDAGSSRLQRALHGVIQFQWWLLCGLAVAGGVLYYQQPLRQPTELRALVAEAQKRKDALAAERKRVLERIEWLKTEPGYIEAKVRDKLNKQKEGETILQFE